MQSNTIEERTSVRILRLSFHVSRAIRGIDLIAQKDSKKSINYYLYNAHGDVTKVVNSYGNVLNSYSYDAFGNTQSYTEIAANRARFYDPSTG